MKKLILLAALILITGIAHAQTIKTVGTGGDYPTLKLAFDAINAGTITGDITLNIISDITDNNTATLQAGYDPASYTSVLIQPTGTPPSGYWTLTASISGEMIALAAATNVTLNGQLDGVSGESNLYLVNNGAGTPTVGGSVRFEYGACHNLIQYVHFECNSHTDVGAIIFSIGAGAGLGNNNNTIDQCDITKTPSGQLFTGISSVGTPENIRNTITYCNIYDWNLHGIDLPSPCGRGWQIAGNNFYQTSSFSSHADSYAIRVINGDSIAIQQNRIGGSQPNSGGTAWVNTYAFNSTYGIYVEGDNTMTAYIDGNSIKNIETHGTRFCGIEVIGVNAAIISNQIGGGGESGGGGGIVMTGIGTIYGIMATATSTPSNYEVSYNGIQNITASNLLEDEVLCGVYVFSAPSGNTVAISNNTIENLLSHGNCSGPLVRGILTSCTSADVTITGNQVSNLVSDNGGSFATEVQGIVVSGDNGSAYVSKNKIYNLLDNCTGNPSIHGVVFHNRNCQIRAVNNMISITNGSNLNNVEIYGLYDPGLYGVGTESHLFYYNSVFIGGSGNGSSQTSCYKRDVNLRSTLINNVFFNARTSPVWKNFAVSVNSDESTDFYSDHNDFFSVYDNTIATVTGGTAPLTFTQWQSAFSTPHDMNSHSVNPGFLSATDLHIEMNATLNNTGLVLVDVPDDIDGNPRDPLHPDPGINEFFYNNYTVGDVGTYPTLAVAFDDINAGNITGNVYLEVISNILDYTQAVLNASGTGPASYSSVVIRPGGPMPAPPWDYYLLRANMSGPMIKLMGASNVTIDGYKPGDESEKRLIFQNSNGGDSLGWVFSLVGGANSNIIKNCLVMANCKGYAGAIHFGESLGSPVGNSNNTIENCEITYAHYWVGVGGVGVLNNGITCDTLEQNNNYNIIRNCAIRDCRGSAILIGRPADPITGWNHWGNDAWEISGNHIYNSVDRPYFRPSYFNPYYRDRNGICIARGNSHFISANHFDGSGDQVMSSAIKIFGGQNYSPGQPVTIHGNVISRLGGLQYGIYVENQDANIEYDTIGSPTLANNILTGGQVFGIFIYNQYYNHTVKIKNNLIANITSDAVWGNGVMMAGIGTNPNGNSLGPGCEISNNKIYRLHLHSGPQCPAPPYVPSTPKITGIMVCGESPIVNGNTLHSLFISGDDYPGTVDSVEGIYVKSTGNSMIFNNMVSLERPPSVYTHRTHYVITGILDVSAAGSVNDYYYNTVCLLQTTSFLNYSSTFCFNRTGNAANHLRNNILCNNLQNVYTPSTNAHYAIGVGNPYLFGSNHNDLYSYDPNRLGTNGYGSSNLDFTGWQQSFYMWQDLSSVSIEPLFVSDTDLHCTGPEELDNRGVCVPGITTDKDGFTRENPPDVGANEFTLKIYTTWLGGTNSFWDEPTNWSTDDIPTAFENVKLAFSVNSPVIRSSGAVCKDLRIDPGVTLTVNPGQYVDVMGDIVLVKFCP